MSNGTEVFRTWFRRVWKENDLSAIDEMFPSCPSIGVGVAEGLGAQKLLGPDDFKVFQQALSGLISDIEISIDKSIDDGEWTSLLCVLCGKCKSTGKSVKMTGTVFGHVKDGKILHAYNHWDFMGLWSQMELLPEDCFTRCLQGKKIV